MTKNKPIIEEIKKKAFCQCMIIPHKVFQDCPKHCILVKLDDVEEILKQKGGLD